MSIVKSRILRYENYSVVNIEIVSISQNNNFPSSQTHVNTILVLIFSYNSG